MWTVSNWHRKHYRRRREHIMYIKVMQMLKFEVYSRCMQVFLGFFLYIRAFQWYILEAQLKYKLEAWAKSTPFIDSHETKYCWITWELILTFPFIFDTIQSISVWNNSPFHNLLYRHKLNDFMNIRTFHYFNKFNIVIKLWEIGNIFLTFVQQFKPDVII